MLSSVGVQVDIPKGYSSEKFLFQKVFIPKGHYSEKFYLEELLFRKVFIPKFGKRLFWIKIFEIDDPSG